MLRRLWTERTVDHAGRFFTVDQAGIVARPAAPIPLWFGAGRMDRGGFPSSRSLDRAARLADGFKFAAPTFADLDRVAGKHRRPQNPRGRRRSRPRDLRVRGADRGPQMTSPNKWADDFERCKAIGATNVGFANRIVGGTVDEQLDRLHQFVDATGSLW